MPNVKCMLAGRAPEKIETLAYPLSASYKLDGVRALVIDGKVYSRNMRLIPSVQIQQLFGKKCLNGLDGELIAGKPNAPDAYRRTMSAASAVNNPDDVTFWVFDDYTSPQGHAQRLAVAAEKSLRAKHVRVVEHARITTSASLQRMEETALNDGYEGLMLRAPDGKYKFGRSTEREGLLLKLKRFADSEAEILGFEEQQHNANALEQDALGRAKRSSVRAGLVAAGVLGAVHVRDVHTGTPFNIGSGFTAEEREMFWRNRDALKGRVVKYKFFPSGNKSKPRFPVFCGFRESFDY